MNDLPPALSWTEITKLVLDVPAPRWAEADALIGRFDAGKLSLEEPHEALSALTIRHRAVVFYRDLAGPELHRRGVTRAG